MGNFKKYNSYKNTSLDWMPETPSHWQQTQIKAIAKTTVIKNKPKEELLSVYREYGVIPKNSRTDNHNVDGKDLSAYKYVKKGNLVVNKMKAWQGSMGVSEYNGIVSPAYIVCSLAPEVVPQYAHYLLRSKYLISLYNQISYGVRIGQWDMRYSDFKNLPFFIPPVDEQEKIISFCKFKELQINKLVKKEQDLISQLSEQKDLIINEIVTRGLNKEVKFKKVDLNWIDEIPENWNIVPNRKLFSERKSRNHINEELLSVTIKNGIMKQADMLSENTVKKDSSNEDKSKYKLVEINDIAYNKMRMWQGAVGYSNYRGIVSPAYIILKPISELSSKYYHYLFRSLKYVRYSYNNSYGICDDQLSLRYEDFKTMYSIVPPLKEQMLIAEYLDNIIMQIDKKIKLKQNLILKLEEYKKNLVSNAVTGQIDVRNYVINNIEDDVDLDVISAEVADELDEVAYANN